ncbi:helix-turn-helix transcriptional regulator [Phascolarctobacterium succinatutens]|uniref:helix-turn-helix domain-containing protein n=1 Tax=Phascolarctobacterium succinatutens TaxID=626940 RepID=UPI00307E443D
MRLKEVRKASGLTQREVATYVGVNQNTYSYWENGKTKIDSESIAKLAKLFNVSIDYLLDGSPCKTNIENFISEKPAVRSDHEKLLGVYDSLDEQSKNQLMSVAYLIMSQSLKAQGIDVQDMVEQQLHKIQNEGGE